MGMFSFLLEYNGFPGGSDGKESDCDVGDPGLIPGSGRSPGEKKRHAIPVFLPGEFHGQRSLVGYSPWGCKESDTTKRLTHIIQLRFCDLTLEPPEDSHKISILSTQSLFET